MHTRDRCGGKDDKTGWPTKSVNKASCRPTFSKRPSGDAHNNRFTGMAKGEGRGGGGVPGLCAMLTVAAGPSMNVRSPASPQGWNNGTPGRQKHQGAENHTHTQQPGTGTWALAGAGLLEILRDTCRSQPHESSKGKSNKSNSNPHSPPAHTVGQQPGNDCSEHAKLRPHDHSTPRTHTHIRWEPQKQRAEPQEKRLEKAPKELQGRPGRLLHLLWSGSWVMDFLSSGHAVDCGHPVSAQACRTCLALLDMSFELCTLTLLWDSWRWTSTNVQRGIQLGCVRVIS